jgi:DNA-binding HxlR family transcriptional regulator
MAIDRKNKDFNPLNCPVTACMNKIGGKWKPVVIFLITKGKNRFSMLQKAIPDISKQMLVNQLRELEKDNLIERIIYAEMPPRVEYRISEYGETILPIISVMADWGKTDLQKNQTPIPVAEASV